MPSLPAPLIAYLQLSHPFLRHRAAAHRPSHRHRSSAALVQHVGSLERRRGSGGGDMGSTAAGAVSGAAASEQEQDLASVGFDGIVPAGAYD
jgi:hypothetical protein